MRRSFVHLAAASSLSAAGAAAAGTVTPGDVPGGSGGIEYTYQADLEGPGDSVTIVDSVGAKSWADPMNLGEGDFGFDAGWTHTSNWIHLEVAEAVDLTITLAAKDGVPDGVGGTLAADLVPAMSLWSGADNDGGSSHSYEQGSVPSWIDAAGFAFLDHLTTGPGAFDGDEAVVEVSLAAGVYTLAVGGHDTESSAHEAGYELTIVAAPEPGGAAILATGAAALAAARCRRSAARRSG
jgi:hypothetical protein